MHGIQTFSEKMSRHLSSLAPGFEGHYEYVPYLLAGTIEDLLRYEVRCKHEPRERLPSPYYDDVRPVPAWQVEDVLRNLTEIQLMGHKRTESSFIMRTVVNKVVDYLAFSTPDTAYQKIEEYLWSVLK